MTVPSTWIGIDVSKAHLDLYDARTRTHSRVANTPEDLAVAADGWVAAGVGVALSVQVTGQAIGPVLSGAPRDWTGDYRLSLAVFTGLSLSAAVRVAFLRPVRRPVNQSS